jgi:hypothetical protein
MNMYSGLATFGRIRTYIISALLILISLITGVAGLTKVGAKKTRPAGEKLIAVSAVFGLLAAVGLYMVRYKAIAALDGVGGVANIVKMAL